MSDLKEQLKASIEMENQPGELLFTPLRDDVEYVDATEFQIATIRRLKEQEQVISKLMMALQQTQNGLLAAQKSLLRAHERMAEINDRLGKQSGLILPDRMN